MNRKVSYFLCMCFMVALSARAACVVCGKNETAELETVKAHQCLGVVVGTARVEKPNMIHYNGVQLGLMHASLPQGDVLRTFIDEQCELNGVSVEVLANLNVGDVNGVSVNGLFGKATTVTGTQISGALNASEAVNGAQVALLMNLTDGDMTGVQFGLVNVARKVRGVQIGLLNRNLAGWILPFINISW